MIVCIVTSEDTSRGKGGLLIVELVLIESAYALQNTFF
jgi:hypothetical protein